MEGHNRCLLSHGKYSGGCPHPCKRPVQMEAPCSTTLDTGSILAGALSQVKSSSASQNINSQAISANYVPPTNTRPTFTPATFAPVTRPIQPAAPLISAPRPPQVQPLQPALPTLPDTNPVALPAINRPVIQPINTDPNNVLLMPLQPTGPMPTISNLDVQCGKESMVVTVVFTQVFSGVIYAKGFHTRKECTFVQLNSGQASYTFTLVLDQCGTQFIDELGSGGQAYLENTIIIQMQEEIQESGALKNLFPLLDRVLVEKARSGIEIPEKAQQKVLQATVVAVGPGARNNQSQDIPVTVKVGDKVLLPESGGTKVEIEDKEL
ncbi:uncharacterized protein LOC136036873 isoform X2 [Artemia franciscana]|uniref:uncharacterized protein LOC136036873 isoform X2 n=1 Tax=Artemia franciscana TaxID=6661 RepID=UPI0032DAED6B